MWRRRRDCFDSQTGSLAELVVLFLPAAKLRRSRGPDSPPPEFDLAAGSIWRLGDHASICN